MAPGCMDVLRPPPAQTILPGSVPYQVNLILLGLHNRTYQIKRCIAAL